MESKEKQDLLWQEYNKTKSEKAKEKLMLSYKPLVYDIAYKKIKELPSFLEFKDLISFGNLYLIKCINNYNIKNVKMNFVSYVYYTVSNNLTDELNSIKKTYKQSYGIGVDFISYDESKLDIPSDTYEAPDEYVDKQLLKEVLNELFDKEKKLIELLYYKDFITNKIIAKEFNVSTWTVNKYKNKLINKLRYKLKVTNVKKEFEYNKKRLSNNKWSKDILESKNLLNDFIDNDTYELLLKKFQY